MLKQIYTLLYKPISKFKEFLNVSLSKELFQKKIGQNVRFWRAKAHLSQTELGYRADITQAQLARIENGHVNPTIYTLYTISLELDVSILVLLDM